ncbi:MAG: potassium channel family protein [Aigarchaeota archaeon]|nr:potassium channel family protein [Candidatus Pelearchaeum maunauluense]
MRKYVEIIIAILAIASVFIILVEYILPIKTEQASLLYTIDIIIVVIIGIEFYTRAKQAEDTARYLLKNWYEILALVPAFFFALLESQTIFGAVLRGLRLIRVVRLIAAAPRIVRAYNVLSAVMRESKLAYLTALSAMIISVGAVTVYILEADNPNAKITTLNDAFWWALATVTTVGYGDVVPVTPEGRVLGTILMITGIAILGILISTLGATLVERRMRREETLSSEVREMIKKKIDTIESLTQDELELLLNLIKRLHKSNKYNQDIKAL